MKAAVEEFLVEARPDERLPVIGDSLKEVGNCITVRVSEATRIDLFQSHARA